VDILHVEARAGDFSGTEVSGARADRELGWTAATPFVDGVRRYVEWLRTPSVDPDPVG
jgi:UDP-glucose 4-epimerase